MSLELKLKAMEQTVKAMDNLLSVIREEDYLIVEHDDYGHIVELHEEDYPEHKIILRKNLEFVMESSTPPWIM